MISSLIDFTLIIGGLAIILNQIRIQKKIKGLVSVLSELQPAIVSFSEAVDKGQNTIECLKKEAETTRLVNDKQSKNDIPHIDTQKHKDNTNPIIHGGIKLKKEDMVKDFFEITRGKK